MQQVKYSINKEEEEDEEMNQSMYLIVDDHTYTTYIRISFRIILLNGRRLHLDRTHTHTCHLPNQPQIKSTKTAMLFI